jgi:hypothetical protein
VLSFYPLNLLEEAVHPYIPIYSQPVTLFLVHASDYYITFVCRWPDVGIFIAQNGRVSKNWGAG